MSVYVLDPSDVLDFQHDWDDNWLAAGETISASTWTISPTGPNITSPAPSNTTTTTTCWVSGCTLGQVYRLVNHITTSASRQTDRTVVIRCEAT